MSTPIETISRVTRPSGQRSTLYVGFPFRAFIVTGAFSNTWEPRFYRSWRNACREIMKKDYAPGAQDVPEEKSHTLWQLSGDSAWHRDTRRWNFASLRPMSTLKQYSVRNAAVTA